MERKTTFNDNSYFLRIPVKIVFVNKSSRKPAKIAVTKFWHLPDFLETLIFRLQIQARHKSQCGVRDQEVELKRLVLVVWWPSFLCFNLSVFCENGAKKGLDIEMK